MASNFASLRSSRSNLLTKLTEEMKKQSKGQQDDRYWKLSTDAKTGVGFATIRFLPAPKGEDLPWVRVFNHGFKTPSGAWFIENCPTTLPDHQCPVCKENSRLWNAGGEGSTERKTASARKRKLNFISNILVVDDAKHPENNGKVFLFRYGKKIHDKISELMEPQFPDQQPANPFDLWEGCDFKLRASKKDNFQNYDKSEFAASSEVCEGDDEAKEKLWDSQHSLTQFIDEKQFKDYAVLDKAFGAALNDSGRRKTAEDAITDDDAEELKDAAEETPKPRAQKAAPAKTAAPKPAAKPAPKAEPAAADGDEDEEDLKNFFAGVTDDE